MHKPGRRICRGERHLQIEDLGAHLAQRVASCGVQLQLLFMGTTVGKTGQDQEGKLMQPPSEPKSSRTGSLYQETGSFPKSGNSYKVYALWVARMVFLCEEKQLLSRNLPLPFFNNREPRASERAHQVKVSAVKVDDLSSIPQPYLGRRADFLTLSSGLHTHAMTHKHPSHTYPHTTKSIKI